MGNRRGRGQFASRTSPTRLCGLGDMLLLLLFLTDCLGARGPDPGSLGRQLLIGYLPIDKTPDGDRLVERQFRVISGALTYAIETIKQDEVLPPGYSLDFVWNDTYGTVAGGLAAITDQWRKGVDVFLGPEETCNYEGRVAAAWNLPMLSFKCADDEVSDKENFPTFARTRPPAAQVTTSILSLLLHFNWTRYSLIAGSSHAQQSVKKTLLQLSEEYNLTVNHVIDFKEPYLSLKAGNPFPGIVQETYITTRVYVFLGQLNAMVDMMTNLNDRSLLETGDYIVIFIDHRSRTIDNDLLKYFKRSFDPSSTVNFPNGERALLVITPTAVANSNTTMSFHKKVIFYNSQPPFQFPNPFNFTKLVTDYAAYLFDAVYLYAQAVSEVIKQSGDVRNGRAIIDRLRGRSYKSVLGYLTRIGDNGDAEGNFTLLAFKHHPSYTMKPVADFVMTSSGDLPSFRLFDGETIPWINGQPPEAEPECGYLSERCIPKYTYVKEIVLGVLGGVLLVFAGVVLIVYRNWRYEQEIDGLLWKIDSSAIQMGQQASPLSNEDRCNHDGGGLSIVSTESRNSYMQVFVKVRVYKGRTVALKMYEKNKVDLGRHTKKEMKLLRDLRHVNVNSFIGASVDTDFLILVTEYCSKGSLTDVLENEDISLDKMFIASIVKDILQGMIYLHDSELQLHGNLKSSNCLITSRWTVQVGDYGLLDVRALTYHREDVFAYYRNLLWKAPELLRSAKSHRGSCEGDIYAFGIVLYEIFGRCGPFANCKLQPQDIIANIKNPKVAKENPFRPDTSILTCDTYIIDCMKECWAETPEQRPDFKTVWQRLKPMRAGMKRNILDHMMAMMERHQERLEELVEERTIQLVEEKKKTETLLHRMLPQPVAEHLKRGEPVIPEAFDSVTIYFSDICGFTKLSADSTPMEVVDMLNDLYTTFDSTVKSYDVYKVETIGDAYMVVSGLPIRNGDLHAGEIASMSMALLAQIKSFRIRHRPDETLKLRIGIHSGPCVAGVVGLTMPRYTLFGDTVNTASRMETNGEPLKVHCSKECKEILEKLGGYTLEERGYVTMKGKGTVLTYWLTSENPEVRRVRLSRTQLLRLPGRDSTDSCTPPCLRPLFSNSPLHSLSVTPQGSPMQPGRSRVKLADGASGVATSQFVLDLVKDSDSGKGSDPLNGISQYRGRLHSFRDALQKCHKLTLASNNSNPELSLQARAACRLSGQLTLLEVVSSPLDPPVVPVLKSRRQRDTDTSSRLSVYDNRATPTEMSVLLGDRACADDLGDEDDCGGKRERETQFV